MGITRLAHPGISRPSYRVAHASYKSSKPTNRGLLFYPVSLGNSLHQAEKLHAAMRLIRDVRHPDTDLPNLVIHLTDGIYAFNYQIENPELPLEDARAVADENGIQWVNTHLTGILEEMRFQPVILHWNHWDGTHEAEYEAVLDTLEGMWQNRQLPFYELVQEDVNAFIHRRDSERNELASPAEAERVRNLSTQFVLHECAGYILIGRHIVKDYMTLLHDQCPDVASVIDAHGGLMDGAFRIYPGDQLSAIAYLQKQSKNLPESIRGANGIKPTRIELDYVETSNHNALTDEKSLRLRDAAKKITEAASGASSISGITPSGRTDAAYAGATGMIAGASRAFNSKSRHRFPDVTASLI